MAYAVLMVVCVLIQAARLLCGYTLEIPSIDDWLKSIVLVAIFSLPLSTGSNCINKNEKKRTI